MASHIGKLPVTIPAGVEVKIDGQSFTAKGAKGTDSYEIPEGITAVVEGNEVVLTPADDLRPTRAKHGLARSIVAGMVKGVHEGYAKTLEIVGTGYRAQMKGKGIEFSLGYSHTITVEPPAGIEFELPNPNQVIVKGIDKQAVGQCAANIRKLRAPEPYKGKGIKYADGFRLGPCINASGRLDTAMRSLSLLQCEDEEEAAKLANDLKALNDSRKALTEQGTEAAYKLINGSNLKNDRVMVVFLPDCHESLAGIIAGRIREKYHKPAFVLTRGEKSVKGSGRSTENYSMYEELVKCDSLLLQYGGHPMAAGLSIEEANVEAFRRQLNENCTLTEEDMIPKIVIDVPMPISYINENLIRQLSVLEPFGKGNAKPVFAQKNLRVLKTGIYGKTQNTVKLQLMDESGTVMDGVYWGEAKEFAEFARSHGTISVTYYPKINSYMGRDSLQIVIQNYC